MLSKQLVAVGTENFVIVKTVFGWSEAAAASDKGMIGIVAPNFPGKSLRDEVRSNRGRGAAV
jgi:hypothetical protein